MARWLLALALASFACLVRAGPEPLILEVQVNGQPRGEFTLYRDERAEFYLRQEDLHALGLGGTAERARGLRFGNVTLVPLPPYSPALNPVERAWLYLRERFLSLRVFRDYRAIVDACCNAWNRLVAEPGRLRSLCNQPWIRKVTS